MAIVASHLIACGLVLAQVAPPSTPPASVASPARAGEAAGAPPLASARSTAQAVLAQGNQRLKDGDAAGAISEYRRAQKIYPPAAAKIEFNIAKAEQERGDQPAAAAAFERFLSQSLEISPEFRDEARNELQRLAAALGALKVAEKRPGLLVAIDGQVQGTTPLPGSLWVRPGHRVVTVNDGDKVAFRQTIEVASGATIDIDVTVRVSEPDRNAAGKTPPATSLASLQLTPHQTSDGSQTPLVQDGPADPPSSPIWKKWWFWGAGAAVIIAGTAAVLILANGCPDNTECMPAALGP